MVENDANNIKVNIMAGKKGKRALGFWCVEIFFISLLLCFVFSIISQLLLINASLALDFFFVLLLIFVSVFFDVVGVAVAASNIKPFLELRRKKPSRGVDKAIGLVKNADRVSSICTDVVGDICSIVSGASGVAISIILIKELPSVSGAFLSTFVSSIIAALTVLGKALGKNFALTCSTKILLFVGKILSTFGRKGEKSKTKSAKKP